MKLQLLFGQADNDKDEPKANVVDLSINNHLDGKLISGDLNQQLRSLDQFKSKYDIYKTLQSIQMISRLIIKQLSI